MLAPREIAEGKVVVRDMTSGEQVAVKWDEVAAWLTREEASAR